MVFQEYFATDNDSTLTLALFAFCVFWLDIVILYFLSDTILGPTRRYSENIPQLTKVWTHLVSHNPASLSVTRTSLVYHTLLGLQPLHGYHQAHKNKMPSSAQPQAARQTQPSASSRFWEFQNSQRCQHWQPDPGCMTNIADLLQADFDNSLSCQHWQPKFTASDIYIFFLYISGWEHSLTFPQFRTHKLTVHAG